MEAQMKKKLVAIAAAAAFLTSTQAQAVTFYHVPYLGITIGHCSPVQWNHPDWLPCFSI
jgi:hypothetical protein